MRHLLLRPIFLTLRVLRLFAHPAIVPILAAVSLGLILRRVLAGYAERAAAIAITVGFAALFPRQALDWPMSVVLRLPGAGLILLGFTFAAPRLPPRLALPALSAVIAWWLAGVPLQGAAFVQCVPIALGLWAGFVLARRFTRANDPVNLGSLAAALALAAALYGTGAATHWARAALVVAAAAAALLGRGGASPSLGRALVVVTAAAIIASEQGAVWPIDLSLLAPVLAWLVVARLPVPAFLAPPPPVTRKRQTSSRQPR